MISIVDVLRLMIDFGTFIVVFLGLVISMIKIDRKK
ncbi:putative holin-like toxin [Staphylococcus microti]|nr:putative holin-like toxin [Staphylococcus microti]